MVVRPHVLFVFFFFFLSFALSPCSRDCPGFFECGNLGRLMFPLTTPERKECGILPIYGCKDPSANKTVKVNGKAKFQVKSQGDFPFTVLVTDKDLQNRLRTNSCDVFSNNMTLPPKSALGYCRIFAYITAYRCKKRVVNPPKQLFNYTGCPKSKDENIYLANQIQDDRPSSLANCSRVQLPLNGFTFSGEPVSFIASDFLLQIGLSEDCQRCQFSQGSGSCQLNSTGGFYCSKPKEHEVKGKTETDDQYKRLTSKLLLIIGFGVGSGILVFALVFSFRLFKHKKNALSHVRLQSMNHYSNEPDPDSGRLFFGVPIFSYNELQSATNNFDPSNKLGDGGFGSVYYGKLQDRREVAVKHLYNHSYKRVEQFMTEVEILTRLRHKNLVSLYGCTSRQSRELLLVYEYIPNGTLASHLRSHSTKPTLLAWPTRIKIAIETASALAYLHASGIIHRDVKTNNILLDNNLCVKVVDFGLSSLFPEDISHVSTAPQGTPGYLDPEYHFCFRLTNKSDVYSFGVVLIELISSLPVVDMGRNNGEITLGSLAVRKIQRNEFEQLVDPCLGIEKDSELKRKVTAMGELAFQCLQIKSEMRPSIDEVLDILREIEREKKDSKDAKEDNDNGGSGISKNKAGIDAAQPMMASITLNQATFFKSSSSPNNVTEKWTSESTNPNLSV